YPRYREAFERKRQIYRPLLPPAAEVLEIGSHLGAFLEVAENWGWKPIGLDIGAETGAFAKRQGATIKRAELAEFSPRLRRLDAVFIWNCFEQLEDPQRILAESRQRVAEHGLIVLRVPNGDFYRRSAPRQWRSLTYNNLLGFPYLNGYGIAS